ncbi:hypothetical protein OMO38_13495 [Chryseobacterium sp. 09-1422]|uniref:Uncharacterized protein n=1 Tax=Chryseobacterium kimseyorum TaxID=2984028 RepID=A0ABT3I0H6_9FLAO|nr:hypothetical protein [Chryseobacterium kimseyorum]MCW3169536.1 hypothetical protein [Chryseobacterium kimseyorum]
MHFISGNDVYIAGTGSLPIKILEDVSKVTSGSDDCAALSLDVSGDDIYLAW